MNGVRSFRRNWISRNYKPHIECECSHISWTHSNFDACLVPGCGCTKFKQLPGANKYGARKTKVKDEHYDSKYESKVGFDLENEKRAGAILDFKRQVPIELRVNGFLIAKYYADFLVTHSDGSEEIIEAKGFFTDYAKLKWKLFTAIYSKDHPEIKITMLKYTGGWRNARR